VTRSIPQVLSLAAIVAGVALFGYTLYSLDLRETAASARRLGLALPLILLPGTAWHLLRTWGWAMAFPVDARPTFTRLFRVRLAADALSYFTVRGVVGEPLKLVLLYDRVAPEITTAAVTLERLAFAVWGIVAAGLIAVFAVSRLSLTLAWDTMFRLLAIGAVLTLLLLVLVVRHRGDYLGPFVEWFDRVTGRHLGASRAVRFVVDVEHVLLALLRGGRRRLVLLSVLPIVCYALMALEVWLVFWAIGEPVGLTESLAVETFARLVSIASAAIPGNLGAMEAASTGVSSALGLAGGGALALVRRLRSLLWAGLGLALYPRVRR
jgi:uncharacterized protein (TIRG00374 family)